MPMVFSAFVVGRGLGMETDISTINLLILVVAVVTVFFAVRSVLRWCGNRDYHKLNEVEMMHGIGDTVGNTV